MTEQDNAGDQTQSARRWQLGWHLLALILICAVRFSANHDSLLSGVDGSYATFSQVPGVLFTDPLSVLSVSPYFGLGATFPGPSPFTDPFGLVLYATGSAVAAYVLLAVIMFLSIYALARALGLSIAAALASGWLMVVAVLPLGQTTVPLIEIASLIHPSSTYVIAMFCMVAALFLHVGRCDVRWNAGLAAGFLVVIAASWINNLTFMVLALPYTAIALAIFTVTAASWREAAWKAGCIALAFGLYGWLGVGAFVDSFTAFSPRLDSMIGHSSGFMAHERRYLLSLMNTLHYDKFVLFFLKGASLLGWVGFAGLIQGTLLGNLRWRLLCVATLGVAGGLTLLSAEYSLPGVIWPWAAPGYFERATYPVYVIAAVLLTQQLTIFARTHFAAQFERVSPRLNTIVQHPHRYQSHALAVAVLFAAVTSLIGSGPSTLIQKMTAAPVTFPPPDSPWRKVAALVPVEKGQPFKGWFSDPAAPAFDHHVQIWRSGGGTTFTIPAEDTLHGAAMRRLEVLAQPERQSLLLAAYGVAYVHWPSLQAGDAFEAMSSDIMPGLFRVRASISATSHRPTLSRSMISTNSKPWSERCRSTGGAVWCWTRRPPRESAADWSRRSACRRRSS